MILVVRLPRSQIWPEACWWRRLRTIERFAHVKIDAAVALAGFEHFGREYFIFGARLLDGVAGAQGIGEPIQIQVDAVGVDAAQLRGGIHVGRVGFLDVGIFGRFEARSVAAAS